MLYSRLVSDEAEVLPEYYLEQYQEEGDNFQESVVHGPQDETEAVREELEDSVKKYYAFYCLPCDEFSQTELEEYAVNTWLWTPKPSVRQGEEILSPELFTGIGLDFNVKGTAEHFTVIGADGHSHEFSYSFWEEKETDWTNNETVTLPVWYHLRDGYPVGIEDETGWMYREPVIGLKEGYGYFHNLSFYALEPKRTVLHG